MSFLPNEIFADLTYFLPNDDITDLMLMSRNFNAFVTPRLKKIDQEMSTMNQSIKSLMPSETDPNDNDWIFQLNLKRFEPIGSKAKNRMKQLFAEREFGKCFNNLNWNFEWDIGTFDILKKGMSLERFDDATFLRILFAFVFTPKFQRKYNISMAFTFHYWLNRLLNCLHFKLQTTGTVQPSYDDVSQIFCYLSSQKLIVDIDC